MTNEEVIRTLTRLKNQINFEWTDAQKKMDALNMAIKALQGQQWIPCSERLPEKEDWYIVTMKGDFISTAPMYYTNGEWCDGHMCAYRKQNQIVAWMKKPKAYRE